MKVKRQGHRYIHAATGKTIDSWFPLDISPIERSCPAEQYGFIKDRPGNTGGDCGRKLRRWGRFFHHGNLVWWG